MLTLDYNSAIYHQYQDLEKGKRKFDFRFTKFIRNVFSISSLIRRLNGLLISQLLHSKGTLAELNENIEAIQGLDLSKGITLMNKLLKLNISFQLDIEEIIKEDKENKYPGLVVSQSVLAETIENIYSIVRILKKANLKAPQETSELAKDLSRRSVKSLGKVLYGN